VLLEAGMRIICSTMEELMTAGNSCNTGPCSGTTSGSTGVWGCGRKRGIVFEGGACFFTIARSLITPPPKLSKHMLPEPERSKRLVAEALRTNLKRRPFRLDDFCRPRGRSVAARKRPLSIVVRSCPYSGLFRHTFLSPSNRSVTGA